MHVLVVNTIVEMTSQLSYRDFQRFLE
eukprot:COSAG05_NODE_8865_length_666_cov_0.894180_2_plen_26_part_01